MLRTINRAARSKQAVVELERELERQLQERETLGKDLANIKRRQKSEPSAELASEEDTLAANLNYIQESIQYIQHSIMELEEGREQTSESQVLHNMVEEVSTIDEAKFLLEKLCSTAILQTCDIALTQSRLMEREAILNEVQQDSSIQQQLLQHVLSQSTPTNSATDSMTAAAPILASREQSHDTHQSAYFGLGKGELSPPHHSPKTTTITSTTTPPPPLRPGLQRQRTFDLTTERGAEHRNNTGSSRSISPSLPPSSTTSLAPSTPSCQPDHQ